MSSPEKRIVYPEFHNVLDSGLLVAVVNDVTAKCASTWKNSGEISFFSYWLHRIIFDCLQEFCGDGEP
jgi:hypothetical protein